MRHLGTWLTDGLGSIRLRVGLNYLSSLFRLKQFYESISTGSISEKMTVLEVRSHQPQHDSEMLLDGKQKFTCKV